MVMSGYYGQGGADGIYWYRYRIIDIVNQGCSTYYGGITAAKVALDA